MGYSKQPWANGAQGQTPLSATRLGHLEDGVLDASRAAEDATSAASNAVTAAAAAQSTAASAMSNAMDARYAASDATSLAQTALYAAQNATPSGGGGSRVVGLTQAQWNALASKDPSVLYVITG